LLTARFVRALMLSLALSTSIAAGDVLAASPALTLELVDDHPVGVRVYVTTTLAGWSVPRTYCRRRACVGGTKICPPHPSAPFELAIPSRLP